MTVRDCWERRCWREDNIKMILRQTGVAMWTEFMIPLHLLIIFVCEHITIWRMLL